MLKRKSNDVLTVPSTIVDSKKQKLAEDSDSTKCPLFSLPDCVLDTILNDYDYSTREKFTHLNGISSRLRRLWHPAKRTHPFELSVEDDPPDGGVVTKLNDCPINRSVLTPVLADFVAKFSISELTIQVWTMAGFMDNEHDKYYEARGTIDPVNFTDQLTKALAKNPRSLRRLTSLTLTAFDPCFFNDIQSIDSILKASDVLQSIDCGENIQLPYGDLTGLRNKRLKSVDVQCTSEQSFLGLCALIQTHCLENVRLNLSYLHTPAFFADMMQNGAFTQVTELDLGVSDQADSLPQLFASVGQLPHTMPKLKNASLSLAFQPTLIELHAVAEQWLTNAQTNGAYIFSLFFPIAEDAQLSWCQLVDLLDVALEPIGICSPGTARLHFTRGTNRFTVTDVDMQLCPEVHGLCYVCRCCPTLLLREIASYFNMDVIADARLGNYFITRCAENEIKEQFLKIDYGQTRYLSFARNFNEVYDGGYVLAVGHKTLYVSGRHCGRDNCTLCDQPTT